MDETQVTTDTDTVPEPQRASPRRRAGRWWALLIIIVIVLVAAWFGWRWWQRQRIEISATQQHSAQQRRALTALQADMGKLRAHVAALNTGRTALEQRSAADAASATALRNQLQGLAQRIGQLEAAVASLARQRMSGHDALLLDDAATLLRLGQQRYQLFHDAHAAMRAYALADQALAAVNDPAFASVRQNLRSERAALAATHPAQRARALATLQQLRAQWPELPLKSLDQAASTDAQGAWHRVWHALSTMVRVDRVAANGRAGLSGNPGLVRELSRLDLAQAQAALLAADMPTFHAALQRADTSLRAHFDAGDAGVQQARARLQPLLATTQSTAPPVDLGGALEALENLRAVQALAPASPAPPPANTMTAAPASAASAAKPPPAPGSSSP